MSTTVAIGTTINDNTMSDMSNTTKTGKTSKTTTSTKNDWKMSNIITEENLFAIKNIFSSTVCPAGIGLDNSCQIPFGFVYTPLVLSSNQHNQQNEQHNEQQKQQTSNGNDKETKQKQQQPTTVIPDICLTCLSYRSVYSTIRNDIYWTCVICGQDQNQLLQDITNSTKGSTSTDSTNESDIPLSTVPKQLSSITYEFQQHIDKNDTPTTTTDAIASATTVSNSISCIKNEIQSIVLVLDQNLSYVDAMSIIVTIQDTIDKLLVDDKNNSINNNNNNTDIIFYISLIIFKQTVSIVHLGSATSTSTATSNNTSSIEIIADSYTNVSEFIDSNLQHSSSYTIPITSTGRSSNQWNAVITCIDAFYSSNVNNNDDPITSSTFDNEDPYTSNQLQQQQKQQSKPKSRLEMLKQRKEERKIQQQQQEEERRAKQRSQVSSDDDDDDDIDNNNDDDTGYNDDDDNYTSTEQQKQKQQQQQQMNSSKISYRCTGDAIECAIELAKSVPIVAVQPQDEDKGCTSTSSNGDTRPNEIYSEARTARILLFTNGCPNYGTGSCTGTFTSTSKNTNNNNSSIFYNTVQPSTMARACIDFYNPLGTHMYNEYGIGIDIFCSGSTNELAIPAYQCLVESSSGYVLTYESFSSLSSSLTNSNSNIHSNTNSTVTTPSYQFQRDLKFVLYDTHLSVGQYNDNRIRKQLSRNSNVSEDDVDDSEDDSDNEDDDDESSWIIGCTLDIRMSTFLTPTHLVGPGDLYTRSDNISNGPLPNELLAYELHANQVNNGFQIPDSKDIGNTTNGKTKTSSNNINEGFIGTILNTLRKPKNKKITINISDFMLETSLTRIQLGRYDTKSTFSIMMRLNDIYQHNYDFNAYVQCTIRYMNRTGTVLTTRVTTYKLPIAQSISEYVQAVNPIVVPVLLAKEAVYRSMYGKIDNTTVNNNSSHTSHAGGGIFTMIRDDTTIGPSQYIDMMDMLSYEAQRDIDETISRISRSFRLLCLEIGSTIRRIEDEESSNQGKETIQIIGVPTSSVTSCSTNVAFPPRLSESVRLLYHFRRGPLLSPGPLQSMDDRAETRSLFLRLPLHDSYCMLAPKLWSCSVPLVSDSTRSTAIPYMEDAPPETLALWSNRIVAADYFYSLFIWSGKNVANQNDSSDRIRNHLKQFLLDRAIDRYPMPTLYMLNENESMSRRFTSLLAPSHGDAVEHQIANFPSLAFNLSESELQQLRLKFTIYNPIIDPSFRDWFWSVSSAITTPSKNKNDYYNGESLCE